jgi:hypothetical protein
VAGAVPQPRQRPPATNRALVRIAKHQGGRGMNATAHEIIGGFLAEGLKLDRVLVEMLNDVPSHCTERRGCGYTQATRFLSRYINQPRDPIAVGDLAIFDDWPLRESEQIAMTLHSAGWPWGWRRLDEAGAELLRALPASDALTALRALRGIVRRVHAAMAREESRLWLVLLEQVLSGDGTASNDVPGMPTKPDIGSCSQAEEFFLELAHGRVRRGGAVNVVLGADGAPIMVEKMNLGESHSAIVVAPFRINGVVIPVGGLCALQYVDPPAPDRPSPLGRIVSLHGIAQARFLRLTTLAVAPEVRRRAFTAQVDAQIRSNMLSPLTATMAQLQKLAREQLADAG